MYYACALCLLTILNVSSIYIFENLTFNINFILFSPTGTSRGLHPGQAP